MNAAALAIEWLSAIISFVRSRILKRAFKVKKYIKDLVMLEENEGATTEAWLKINEAARAGTEVTLTAEDTLYLSMFKAIWDRYLKKPMSTLAEVFAPDDDE